MRFKSFLTLVASAAILLAAPASGLAAKPQAKAKPRTVTRTLTGQVVGANLPAGTRVGVPVLFDAPGVRAAKLRGPMGVLRLLNASKVRIPGGKTVTLSGLRAGDAFRVRMAVTPAATRAPLPIFNVTAASVTVTRRGTALSAGELQDQITQLSTYLGMLTGYVVTQFADLRAQTASLRSDLGGLGRAVEDLRAQVAALPSGTTTQITTLITQVTQLQTEVQNVTNQLNTVTSDVSTVAGKLTGISPGDLATALGNIATLDALVGGIDVVQLSNSVSNLATQVGTVGATDLQTQVNQVNAALATAQGQLSFLCSAGLVKGPLLSLSLAGSCPS
jgi:uncharacterized protein YoxC